MSRAKPVVDGEHRKALGAVLMAMSPRVAHLQRHVLGRLDPPISYPQYRILACLAEDTTSMAELRAQSTVTFSTLSETTNSLVRQGLVIRTLSERDRRSVNLAISDEGRRVLAEGEKALEDLASRLLEGIQPPDPAELTKVWEPLSERVRAFLAESHRGNHH